MRRVLMATCIAAACAIGLSAQQTGTSTMAQSGRQGRGGPMTLTGCVKAGDTSGTYMLTNVHRSDAGMGSGATTTTGAASTTGSGEAAPGGVATTGQGMGRGMGQIMLSAGGDVDLSTHVGHKVEVTGTIARGGMGGGAATTTGTGGTTTASGATTTAGSGATTTAAGQAGGSGMRTMHVTSLKMISADCGS